jgi:hypothetical protein
LFYKNLTKSFGIRRKTCVWFFSFILILYCPSL